MALTTLAYFENQENLTFTGICLGKTLQMIVSHYLDLKFLEYVSDIEMTTSAFFFKVNSEVETKGPTILGFDFKKRNNPSFQMAEPFEKDEIDWRKIHVKKVHNIVNLFTGIHIVRIGITMCVITHSKFASLFDLLEWKWVNHIEFETDIIKLFRPIRTKTPGSKRS